MNFYKRHIGDYLKDTAHLSLLEHGVYTRLLDVYYTRESGIPDEQAARLIGARSREETTALKVVLDEFFELLEGTWVQDRCEREINATGIKPDESDGAPAKSGKARRQQEYRERRSALFEALRENGITMPFKATMEELQDALLAVTKSSRVMPTVTDSVMPSVTDGKHNVTATNSHKPDTRLQTPDLKPIAPSGGGGKPAPEDSDAPLAAAQISISLIGWERERHKAARGISASNQTVIEIAEMAVTADELRKAYDMAVADRQATGDPNPVNAGFVKALIDKVRNPPKPRPKADNWHLTDPGTDRKAAELGMQARAGEGYPAFRDRIRAEIQRREQQGVAA